jgi:ABC-type polar amino acid transport system ATPase subunit
MEERLSLEIVETDKLGGLRLTVVDVTELTDNVKKIRQVRSEVSMVFQHFNLFPHLKYC